MRKFSGSNAGLTDWRGYPWLLVGLLWGVALLNYMDRQMLSTMKTAMQIDIHELQSATNFGYLMAIFLWIYGIINPFSGFVADRLNRKWLITGSLFVWSAVTFAMGYATTFNELYFLRGVMGVSEALYMPAALSLIADFHSDKSRSLAIGIHMTGLYTGQALGGFGASVAATHSWHITFHLFGFVGLTYSLILLLFLRDKRHVDLQRGRKLSVPAVISPPFLTPLRTILKNRYFWIILLSFVVFSIPGWATKNWLPTLFAEKLSVGLAVAGPIATITIAVSSFVGVFVGGILSDWWVQRNLRARIYCASIGFGLMAPALLLLGFGQSLFHIILAGCCFGVGFGIFDANNIPILYQFISDRSRATAYGIMNMAGIFGGAIITDRLGRSMDAGNLGRDFAMLAIIVFAAMLLQLGFLHPKGSEAKNDGESYEK